MRTWLALIGQGGRVYISKAVLYGRKYTFTSDVFSLVSIWRICLTLRISTVLRLLLLKVITLLVRLRNEPSSFCHMCMCMFIFFFFLFFFCGFFYNIL